MPQTLGADNLFAKNILGVETMSFHDGTDVLKIISELRQRVEELTRNVESLKSQFDITGVEDGNVLSWNATENKWTPSSIE
jgi:hypothetical protein